MIKLLYFSLVAYHLLLPVFAKVNLDKDHLSEYPYCGKMFGYGLSDASSRMVNSKDSVLQYPWVVFVLGYVLYVDKKDKKNPFWQNTICAGTVITDRHVVTAGHCICALRNRVPTNQPEPHEKALCKPSDENIFYSSYKNQIRKGFNQIVVYGGDMDREKMMDSDDPKYSFDIEKAFAKNRLPNDRWDGKSDIGILVSERALFDRAAFNTAKSFDKPFIVPICLAAKGATFVGNKIRGVGWGTRYYEKPGKPKKPYISSCMTNEAGPERWRFYNCDMQKIIDNNYSCEKQSLPPNIDEIDKEKFKEWFGKARQKLNQSQIQFMDKVDKIHIYSATEPNKPMHIYYNVGQFTKNGWCTVHNKDTNKDPEAWGFCSPSCDNDMMKRGAGPKERLGKVYQVIDWTVETSPVGRNHPCYWDFWNSEYDICMKTILPRAHIGILKTTGDQINSVDFQQDIESKQFISYPSICDGDSGSGQWVTVNEDGSSASKEYDTRSVLVAIAARGAEGIFEVNGQPMEAVCGGNMILDSGELLTEGATAVKATHPVIFGFIKKYSKRTKSKS